MNHPQDEQPAHGSPEHLEQAAALRRSLLGDRMTDAIAREIDAFNRPFQDYATRNVFGGTWLQGALSQREFALVNVGMLAGAGRMEEAGVYMSVALRLGVSLRELQSLLMHITVYCGTPVGRQLFKAARRMLAEEGIDASGLDEPGR